jgi:hypothetical protein
LIPSRLRSTGPAAANKSAVPDRRRVPRSPALRPANLVPGTVPRIAPRTSLAVTDDCSIPPRGFSGRPASRALGLVQAPATRRPLSPVGGSFLPRPGYRVASGHPAPDGSSASASPLGINTLQPAREYWPVSHRLRLSPST